MKNIKFPSLILILIGGALTCFLWLPLLPVVLPIVALTIGARWIGEILVSDAWTTRQFYSQMAAVSHSSVWNGATARNTTPTRPSIFNDNLWATQRQYEPSDPSTTTQQTPLKRSGRREAREYRKFTRVFHGISGRRTLAHP